MMNFIYYFMMMFLMCFYFLIMFMWSSSIYINWEIMWMFSKKFLIFSKFSLSLLNVFFFLMLFICSFMVLYFSSHYFGWVKTYLNLIIICFSLIMLLLVSSKDLLTSLIFWEYLGFISFVLMLYYKKFDTMHAANMTLMSSRVGDVGLFLLVSNVLFWEFSFNSLLVFWFFFIITSKSAMYPLGSWLLEAMRAPTPVSSLVHSSTLVTAGIWFFLNYNYMLLKYLLDYMLVFSTMTMMISGICALYFVDVKKMMALSTCKNISWCFMYYLLGFELLCMIQLITHGIAKCSLFIVMGDILSGSYKSQNSKKMCKVINKSSFNWVLTCMFSLLVCGIPFNGVFFTKHFLMMELKKKYNLLLFGLMIISVLISYLYSGRLLYLLSTTYSMFSVSKMNKVFYFMGLVVVLSSLMKFLFISLQEEVSSLSMILSLLIMNVQVFGLLIGWNLDSYLIDKGVFKMILGQDNMIQWWYNFIFTLKKIFGNLSSIRMEMILYNILFFYSSFMKQFMGGSYLSLIFSFILLFFCSTLIS